MCLCHNILGDRWRVVLKGEVEDYIHAVVVNVRSTIDNL